MSTTTERSRLRVHPAQGIGAWSFRRRSFFKHRHRRCMQYGPVFAGFQEAIMAKSSSSAKTAKKTVKKAAKAAPKAAKPEIAKAKSATKAKPAAKSAAKAPPAP